MSSSLKLQAVVFYLITYSTISFAEDKLVCDESTALESYIEEYDLIELMNIPVVLSASQEAECTHSAASIISTLSGEELLNMGARDLIDALELIPGFNFGSIVFNTVGLGVRGVQADEGKLSVLIDGIILTEQRFGTTAFGSHFPVEHIDRIEVIRGPGSILHGNFAELGVINIITKKGRELDGGVIGASYGRFARGEASKNTHLSMGKAWDDLELSFYGKYNDSHRSDRIYYDAQGDSFDMSESNKLESFLGTFTAKYKGLSLQFLVDEYEEDSRDFFADSMSDANVEWRNRFATYATKLGYQHVFNEGFKLDAGFDFSRQTPWQRSLLYIDGSLPDELHEKVTVDHYKFDIKSTFSAEAGHYFVLGNSFQFENYEHDKSGFSGELPIFGNYTLYGEGVYKTDWTNILVGLRFDWYSEYGTNFSPRVALTKQIKQFHYKLLYSEAFHAPTGGNFQLNEEYNQNHSANQQILQIKPEKTRTYELELGYQFQRNLEVSVNFFYTHIDNFFIYTFDENLDDFYMNSDGLSNWGTETTLAYQHHNWGRIKANYAFYQSIEDAGNIFKALDSDGNVKYSGANLSFPTHKLSVNHNLPITDSFSFNHTLIFSSERHGYSGGTLVRHQPIWIYNIYFRYQDALLKGLDMGLGVYDLFDQQYEYIQLFNGGHPALPGATREIRFNLSYSF